MQAKINVKFIAICIIYELSVHHFLIYTPTSTQKK
jgi:hypothetical protein